eukprot:TRINITY_DN37835_c0_g1_i1.p1 TRINITY_DN37835_c0_g1~~TRINITY_DN37835_c0_g1_i1.p1  ORF type:complete len:573 (+),score=150.34 TRINITY_DN37835_c0_g1_i1:177-1895(+)
MAPGGASEAAHLNVTAASYSNAGMTRGRLLSAPASGYTGATTMSSLGHHPAGYSSAASTSRATAAAAAAAGAVTAAASALGPSQEARMAAMEEAMQRHQRHIDEVVASMATRHSEEASALAMRTLQSKVEALAGEIGTQSLRMVRLAENKAYAMTDNTGSQVTMNGSGSIAQLEALYETRHREQQQEIAGLREQLSSLQAIVDKTGAAALTSASLLGAASGGDSGAEVATHSLELQLRELVLELRKLQQEQQQQQNQGQRGPTPAELESIQTAQTVLKDLQEERCTVAEMLQNVRQEKLEVIAMMHSFVVGKDEALQEMEVARRGLREEFQNEVVRMRSANLTQPMPPAPIRQASTQLRAYSPEVTQVLTTESMNMGLINDMEEVHILSQSVPRRQSSQAQMPQALLIGSTSATSTQVMGTASSARVAASSAAAVAHAASVHAAQGSTAPQVFRPSSQAPPQRQDSQPPQVLVAAAASSAAAPAGLNQMPAAVAVSPVMRTRSTAAEPPTQQLSPTAAAAAAARKQPPATHVRRFVSAGAGVSPRSADARPGEFRISAGGFSHGGVMVGVQR